MIFVRKSLVYMSALMLTYTYLDARIINLLIHSSVVRPRVFDLTNLQARRAHNKASALRVFSFDLPVPDVFKGAELIGCIQTNTTFSENS